LFSFPEKVNNIIYPDLGNHSGIGQPQGIAPTKNQMHGENNSGQALCLPAGK